jgi:acetyltransferase
VEEAVRAAEEIGFPVVLKILSPDITHKTEVDGVALGLEDSAAVRAAFERITQTARAKRPQAKIEGVTVQPMVRDRNALEMILGAKKDFTFGTVIMAGLGGTAAEIFGDRALGFPPLNERLARMMLESLKTWPLIQGYRGKPGANLERLLEVLIRLSYLVADFPEIAELDINPLLVTPRDVVALDARVILDPGAVGKPAKPYSHLVLRPYPEEYVRPVELEGVPLTLRPIKPEDEPLWLHLLGSCSPDTLYARFRSFFRWNAHEVATRYCFNDYDREIGIVVEQEDKGARQFLGVGRLIADPGSATAEYAVLIRDDWQNRGLGGLLTDYCLEIARKWGLKRIVASTSSDNHRMIAVFRKRAFEVVPDPTSDTVDVVRDL